MAKNNKPKGKLIWKILCGVFAFLFAFLMIAGPIANNYATIINMVLGIEGSTIVGDAAEDLPPRFVSDFEDSAAQAAADLVCESVVANGAVLLLWLVMKSAAPSSVPSGKAMSLISSVQLKVSSTMA